MKIECKDCENDVFELEILNEEEMVATCTDCGKETLINTTHISEMLEQ